MAEFDDVSYRLLIDTTPVKAGVERLRIRVQNPKESFVSPTEVGMPNDLKERIRTLTEDGNGIIVACGPPGTGVTSLSILTLRQESARAERALQPQSA